MNLHASHCFDGGTLVCGFPEFHPLCAEPDCKRATRPDWAYCDAHAQQLVERALGIKAPEPQPELPRWSPAA